MPRTGFPPVFFQNLESVVSDCVFSHDSCSELEGWELKVPALTRLPIVGDVKDCIFMTNLITIEDGRAEEEGLDRFWTRLRQVLGTTHIEGLWGTPGSIRLEGSEDALMVYVYLKSSKTTDELNSILGQTIFTPEGEMGEEL